MLLKLFGILMVFIGVIILIPSIGDIFEAGIIYIILIQFFEQSVALMLLSWVISKVIGVLLIITGILLLNI